MNTEWSKLSPQQAGQKKSRAATQIREKRKFFTLRPPARKRREISGWVQWVKWCPHIGQQMHCWQSVAAGPFWPCFACPKLGDAGKTRVASKNRAVFPKTFRPQFSRLNQRYFDIYEISLIKWLGWILKSVAVSAIATPPYFCWQLAFYRHLPTSGRQNTVKTAPQPLIVNSAFVALYVGIILPIVPIPISLFVFDLEAED